MATTKPLILVTGGTGLQGGSVIRFLQQDGGFRIRTITRNPTKDSAIKLRNEGVEVVKADFEDVASLTRAMEGAYGVYGMTDFWEDMDVVREVRQGKHLVDAAKAAGVQHFIWSTLDNTEGLDVSHWRSKARVDDYLKASGIPRTSLYTAFYYENFLYLPPCKVQKDASGALFVDWPLIATDGPIGMYSVQDTGAFVVAAFKNPDKWLNQDMRVQTEVATPRQFVALLEKASGKSIKIVETDAERFEKARSLPNVEELWSNMKWFYMHNGVPNRDMEATHQIYPEVTRLEDWVKANAEKLIA